MIKKEIIVEGMSCNHCKMSVEKAALSAKGVASAAVDLANKRLTVEYDGSEETLKKILSSIEDAGYQPVS